MTRILKILLSILTNRPRPTSSRPLAREIFLSSQASTPTLPRNTTKTGQPRRRPTSSPRRPNRRDDLNSDVVPRPLPLREGRPRRDVLDTPHHLDLVPHTGTTSKAPDRSPVRSRALWLSLVLL